MTFVLRFGISLTLSGLIANLLVHHAQPHAYRTILLCAYGFAWLFLIPISLYSSPTTPVESDAHGRPVPAYARYAARRTRAGILAFALSVAVLLLYSCFATLEFEQQFGWLVSGPMLALTPVGGYMFLTSMCPYCKKLNRPNLRACANCSNPLLPHWIQKRAR